MSHKRLLITCVALCLAAVAACKRNTTPPPVQAEANKPSNIARSEDSCPVQVPATAVTVVNTKNGVAMHFTTMPGNVAEVRRRVAVLAKMDPVEAEASDAGLPDVEPPPSVFGAPAKLVPMQAKAEDLGDGATLLLTPLNPMDVDMLRAYAHNSAQRMRLGRCPADFMRPRRAIGAQGAGSQPADRLG